jgi:hypothetical protein
MMITIKWYDTIYTEILRREKIATYYFLEGLSLDFGLTRGSLHQAG